MKFEEDGREGLWDVSIYEGKYQKKPQRLIGVFTAPLAASSRICTRIFQERNLQDVGLQASFGCVVHIFLSPTCKATLLHMDCTSDYISTCPWGPNTIQGCNSPSTIVSQGWLYPDNHGAG
jgi:hypothetical protein